MPPPCRRGEPALRLASPPRRAGSAAGCPPCGRLRPLFRAPQEALATASLCLSQSASPPPANKARPQVGQGRAGLLTSAPSRPCIAAPPLRFGPGLDGAPTPGRSEGVLFRFRRFRFLGSARSGGGPSAFPLLRPWLLRPSLRQPSCRLSGCLPVSAFSFSPVGLVVGRKGRAANGRPSGSVLAGEQQCGGVAGIGQDPDPVVGQVG